MKKSTIFAAICLISGLFLAETTNAQTANPSTGPSVETAKPAAAPVVKKDKNQKANPNATLDGSAPTQPAAATAPAKPKKARRVDPANIKPVDMSKVETAQPGEKPEDPKATHIPFGKEKPVSGQKTVESAPLKKPADLKPADPKQ